MIAATLGLQTSNLNVFHFIAPRKKFAFAGPEAEDGEDLSAGAKSTSKLIYIFITPDLGLLDGDFVLPSARRWPPKTNAAAEGSDCDDWWVSLASVRLLRHFAFPSATIPAARSLFLATIFTVAAPGGGECRRGAELPPAPVTIT